MKIVHTSDWHLGQNFFNFDRVGEQKSMLRQVEEIVRVEQPDVCIVAGDIYDVAQPSAGVQKMFQDAVLGLHNACRGMTIVCISGNHDSGARHIVYQRPWEELGVYMVGTIAKDNPEEHIIKIGDKGYVVAVPYVASRLMPDGFFQQLYDLANERNTAQLPVVLTAHLAVSYADHRGNDVCDRYIGGIECADESDFSRYDYVALGHIHRAQFIDSSKRIRYAGTPLPTSFDEVYRGCEHTVSVVEIPRGGDMPMLRTIPITNPCPLVNIPAEGAAEWGKVKKQLMAFPDDFQAYLRLCVQVPAGGSLPMGDAEVRKLLEGKAVCYCYTQSVRTAQEMGENRHTRLTLGEFREMSPIDVLERWMAGQGGTLTDEQRRMFHEVEEQINND